MKNDGKANVLAISASEAFREFASTQAQGIEEATTIARLRKPPVMLLDRDLPGTNWIDALKTLLAVSPLSCVILASPVNDAYLWREVTENGGYDVVIKPLDRAQVTRTIDLAMAYYEITPFRTA